MTMIPDQIMDAIHFAEFVMAKEKKDRIGSAADTVYPMKFFFFHGQKEILGLMGGPANHPTLDDKDVNALLVRMCALALDAKAVLHVMECWMSDRCAGCGASVTETRDGRCQACGTETVPPSQNPYRQEMLIATLSVKDSEKSFWWTSRFNRDAKNKIVSFSDQTECKPMEAEGRFMQAWALEDWMGPHFAVNMPAVLKALGKPVDPKVVEIAHKVEKMAPSDYPFLRLNIEDLVAALTRMTAGQN
ncbi:MAG: hypothetical protein QUS33_06830 [Dehalococcoidia bacterium]|nr:hypothetical protein [Dehalococcoidia bacterium]